MNKLEQIEKGTKLIAIDECKMDENDENALIIGKCYTVNSANRLYITINSEIDEMHQFYITELNEFFKISPILKEPNVLQEILENKFKFKYIPQHGVEAWCKLYNGFILYIVKRKKDDLYMAGIKAHETEICIPGFVDEKWIRVFDEENK